MSPHPQERPWRAVAYHMQPFTADHSLGTFGTEDEAVHAAEAHLRERPGAATLVDILPAGRELAVMTVGWVGGELTRREKPENRPEFTRGEDESWADFKRRTWNATRSAR